MLRRRSIIPLSLCAVLLLALPAAAAPGDLDGGFGGGDGKATIDFGASDFAGRLLALPNGKIVQVGESQLVGQEDDFAIARYTATGEPDDSFSGDGRVVIDFNGGNDGAWAVAAQGDKILVAGWAENAAGGDWHFAIVRLRANGTLDGTFGGGDGIVLTPFPHEAFAYDLVVFPDGSFAAVGEDYQSAPAVDDFAVARYGPNGKLADSFGGDGRVTTDFLDGSDGGWNAERIGDKLLVAGWGRPEDAGDYDTALARYRPNGQLDDSFSGDGKRLIPVMPGASDYAAGTARLADNRILIGVALYPDIGFIRIEPNGGLDDSFGGGDGKVVHDFGTDEAIDDVVRIGDKYVAAGRSNDQIATWRIKPGGAPDTSYGGDGMSVASFAGGSSAEAVAKHDGGVVAGGSSGQNFAVARFLLN